MGNVPNRASDTGDFKNQKGNLYVAQWQNFETIKSALHYFRRERDCNRQSSVLLRNQTRYSLEHRASGDYSGFFFSDPVDAFQGPGRTIAPGAAGGLAHTKKSDSACGSVGYISFGIRTEGRTYVVCCGFSTAYSGANSAGIQIRMTDGPADQLGRIEGHGVDPTGSVGDINQLVSMQWAGRDAWTFLTECGTFLKVEVQFTNASWADFCFTVSEL
jgi:hypothetical protein